MANNFKKVTSLDDTQLAAIIGDIWRNLHEVMIRRTNDSKWHGNNIKEPVNTNTQHRKVAIPKAYLPQLQQLHQMILTNLKKKVTRTVEDGKEVEKISNSKVLSETRLYQLASSLPFLLHFWASPENHAYRFRAQDVFEFLDHNGQMMSSYALHPHIKTILTNSPKLDFIGEILDQWQPGDGKLLILTKFVLVAFFAA